MDHTPITLHLLVPNYSMLAGSGCGTETRICPLTLVSVLWEGPMSLWAELSWGLSSAPWCGKWGWQWLRPTVAQMLSITACSLTRQSQIPRPQVLKHLGMTGLCQTLSITLHILSADSWGVSAYSQYRHLPWCWHLSWFKQLSQKTVSRRAC